MTALSTQAGAGSEFAATFAAKGRQSGATSSSGRLGEAWLQSGAGLNPGRLLAPARGGLGPATATAGLSCYDSVSRNTYYAARCSSSCSSSSSSSSSFGGDGNSVVARSGVGAMCRSRSLGGNGAGGVFPAGGWDHRRHGGGGGSLVTAGGSDGRCFSTGAWGPGGGGGSSDEGAGLPPPIIISPVALRVVVIGWMGSNRRYLNKYGSLWARSGDHEVLIVRPSVAQTLVRWRGVVVAGRDIDRVARMHRENPAMPTIYHVFSTGGFIHAGTMWRWIDEVEDVAQRRDLLEEVRGIVLDSAPAAVNPEMSARAIVSAFTNTPAEDLSYGMPGVQGAMLDGTRSFMERYLRSKGVKLRTEEVYDAWYNLAPVCPQLYLYSDADPLVPASDVEKYMGVQESRGVEVSGYRWPDSGHVEHFRRHPHEYAYQISAFLARALKDW